MSFEIIQTTQPAVGRIRLVDSSALECLASWAWSDITGLIYYGLQDKGRILNKKFDNVQEAIAFGREECIKMLRETNFEFYVWYELHHRQ